MEDTLKNNDYCNLATCDTIESDANQKTSVDFELKDKLTGTILQNVYLDNLLCAKLPHIVS